MRNRDLLRFVLTVAALTGCGDEKKSDSTETTTDASLCGRICERSTAAACDNDPVDCAERCRGLVDASPAKCEAELNAFTRCAEKATFTCDEDDESFAKSCAKQLEAWASCQDVDAAPGDEDGDDDGATGNTDRDPEPADPRPPAPPVSSPSSPEANVCEARADDGRCDTCAKSECCEPLAACKQGCVTRINCITGCNPTAPDCAMTCLAGASDIEAQQVLSLVTCLGLSCDVPCSSDAAPNTSIPPTTELPSDCLPPGSVPAGNCDLPATPNAYDCKAPPFPDCVESPAGITDIYCCSQ